MKRVMIIGATSGIATAIARTYAGESAHLELVARDAARLQALAADLEVRGAEVTGSVLDVTDFERHREVVDAVFSRGPVDVVVLAHGTLPDQRACEQDVELLRREFTVNATATLSLLSLVAERMERQGRGTIVAITSVAGVRGRQSNYLYGSAKAAVSTFVEGLRNRLFAAGVHVVDIRPGFVDTPMTRDFDKGLLWADPERIARGVRRAIDRRRATVYLPGFWRPIMLAIRAVPDLLFRRLKL